MWASFCSAHSTRILDCIHRSCQSMSSKPHAFIFFPVNSHKSSLMYLRTQHCQEQKTTPALSKFYHTYWPPSAPMLHLLLMFLRVFWVIILFRCEVLSNQFFRIQLNPSRDYSLVCLINKLQWSSSTSSVILVQIHFGFMCPDIFFPDVSGLF